MILRPEDHPIRSRIDQRAKELLADTQGMAHRASNLAPPDLPQRLEECPQADVGLCCPHEHGSEHRPPTQNCLGLAGRTTRLAVFGQSESQLWRGTRPAVGRRGTRPQPKKLEGLAFFGDWVERAKDIPSAIQRPDNVSESIWAEFLQVLGDVRKRIADNARQILQSSRAGIRDLHANRQRPIPHRAICLRELGRLYDEAANRAKTELEVGEAARRERLSWFDETELRQILGADGEVFVRTGAPYKYGWRTGVEAIRGKKATVEEARACLLAEQEADRIAKTPRELRVTGRSFALPQPLQPAPTAQRNKDTRTSLVPPRPAERSQQGRLLSLEQVPRPHPTVPLSAAPESDEDREDADKDFGDTSAPNDPPEERLPIGWEKKIKAVDRKWFVEGVCDFITDDELRTYVRTMGWSESSNANRRE